MLYVFFFVVGPIVGGVCVFLLLLGRERSVRRQKSKFAEQERRIRETSQALSSRQQELDQQAATLADLQKKLDTRSVSYGELQQENSLMKRDLHNIDVSLRKVELDRDQQRQRQEALDARAQDLARRYLKENIKSISNSMNPNNYAASKQRLLDVVERCRGIGFHIAAEDEQGYLGDLKAEYGRIVRAAFEREEQARIKAQIREEQQREREIQQELTRLDRERVAIQAALEKALAEAKDKHSEEIERLRARLAEAEEKSKRVTSQAQLTKSGHVYVISNIGSFGDGVFKIGVTRRLEPEIRVRELGDASVPFPFDMHMMISCDDAPTLENTLHQALHKGVVNKTNPRKEFFRTDIDTIVEIVKKHHGEVQYVADAEALQYRQSLTMSDEDSEFIETVYDQAEDEGEQVGDAE